MKKIIFGCLIFIVQQSAAQNFNYERSWATYYGGENTIILDNATDSQGNIYIVGYMEGESSYLENFITNNAFQQYYGGGPLDGFVAKFNPDGLLVWSTFFGGTASDKINTIAIDSDDNIFIAGETTSDGMATTGAFRTIRTGLNDGFLAAFNTSGIRLWSTYYGGIYNDSFSGIDCDNIGGIYLFGKTSSPGNITTANSFNENFVPNTEISDPELDYKNFIVKFSTDGIRQWGTYYGTNIENNSSTITGISNNSTGFYVVGYAIDTSQTSYFATPGCHQSFNSNVAGIGIDMFLSRFDSNGSRLWSTYFGGSLSDKPVAFGTGGYGTNLKNVKAVSNFVYIAGTTNSNNNIATANVFQPVKQNYSNFIAKFNDIGTRQWGTYLGNSPPSGSGNGTQYTLLNVDQEGEIFISGGTTFSDIASPGSHQSAIHTDAWGLPTGTESFTARISKDGSTRYFGTYYGGINSEYGANTIIANDDSFYIIGTTQSTTEIATANSHQSELNSFTSSPQLPKNGFISKFSPIPLGTNGFTSFDSVLYPVPNNGSFTLKLNENYIDAAISIYDLQGKNVHSEVIKTPNQHITTNIQTGVYLVKIVNNRGIIYAKKIVVNR